MEVAQRAAEAFLGPLRARSSLQATQRGREPALARSACGSARVGEPSVVAVPLQVQEESIGLLVAYPGERELSESDLALLTALGSQLAVAVQNARLHERATDLGNRLYDVLELEREASRRVTAFYEISRSFTQTLSLDTTLDAVTTTLVEQLGVDAAVIRVPGRARRPAGRAQGARRGVAARRSSVDASSAARSRCARSAASRCCSTPPCSAASAAPTRCCGRSSTRGRQRRSCRSSAPPSCSPS